MLGLRTCVTHQQLLGFRVCGMSVSSIHHLALARGVISDPMAVNVSSLVLAMGYAHISMLLMMMTTL